MPIPAGPSITTAANRRGTASRKDSSTSGVIAPLHRPTSAQETVPGERADPGNNAGDLRAWHDATVARLAELDADRDMPDVERVDALRAMIREGLQILP